MVKDVNSLSLEPLRHRVRMGETSVELPPLSFALLAELHAHRDETVPVERLYEALWGKVTVMPDTLKQRVFLLRKALDDAGLDGIEIQSVRGQGYRLLIEDDGSRPTRGRPRWPWAAAGVAIALVLSLSVWTMRPAFEPPANNRVVYWSASARAEDRVSRWEERFVTELSGSRVLTYVVSSRDPGATVPEQSRASRAALVALWTVVESGDQQRIRMQILEPKTAAVLRTDIADPADNAEMAVRIDEQVNALERLVESKRLPLTRDALVDTDHPAWAALRSLARGDSTSKSANENRGENRGQ